MHADRLRQPLKRLRRALAPADGGALPDGRLLALFVATRDEAAFAALLRRHGPMVLGAVRRLVRHEQDAEDCFQAAFLVLAQRAGSVRGASLASWLYGVAYRVCLRCRRGNSRRRARERQVGQMPQPEVAPPEPQDWRPLLDQELMALPEKYRAAVVVCDLEGKTRKEAARLLRLSEGTLSSRLARARALLAGRLSRRGVALSAAALAAALAGAAAAAVPAPLLLSTAKVAALAAAGQSAAVGPHAAFLIHEVQRGMLMAKLKVGAALAAVAVVLGAGGFAYRAAGQTQGQDRRGPVKSAEVRPATEMDLLRKEVELLKLQVELLQEKVRAQGAELRELKGRPGHGTPRGTTAAPVNSFGRPERNFVPSTAPAPDLAPPRPATTPSSAPAPEAAAAGVAPAPATGEAPATTGPAVAPGSLAPAAALAGPADPAVVRGLAPAAKAPRDPLRQAEAAMKALREARDPEARARAAEALEKAARQLRGRPAGREKPSGAPARE
jgi:RNA polymerase sigma factor (sigma-70 family)